VAYRERLSTTRLLLMAYITKYSHSIGLTLTWGKHGILVRVSKMQLSFIELLYVSAQPLHKVNVTKQNPIEGYAISACLARMGKS
jgi:hypothetical protein